MRPDKSQKQEERDHRPCLAVVAEQLAAVGDEPAALRRVSRLGVAGAREARERSMVRRAIAARRRESAALASELGAGDARERMGSGLLEPVEPELPGGPSAPRRARIEIRQAIEAVLPEDHSAAVTLLTSQLVSKALVHARQLDDASIGLRIIRWQDRVRVEVTDSGPGFDRLGLRRRVLGSGGLGLLAARLSDRWGTTRQTSNQRRRFCVWFELRRSPGHS